MEEDKIKWVGTVNLGSGKKRKQPICPKCEDRNIMVKKIESTTESYWVCLGCHYMLPEDKKEC